VLDHFEAAEHVVFGIDQRLLLLGGQGRRQVDHVFANQLPQRCLSWTANRMMACVFQNLFALFAYTNIR